LVFGKQILTWLNNLFFRCNFYIFVNVLETKTRQLKIFPSTSYFLQGILFKLQKDVNRLN